MSIANLLDVGEPLAALRLDAPSQEHGFQLHRVSNAPDPGAPLVGEPLELIESLPRGLGVDLERPLDPLDRRIVGNSQRPGLVDLGVSAGTQASNLDAALRRLLGEQPPRPPPPQGAVPSACPAGRSR